MGCIISVEVSDSLGLATAGGVRYENTESSTVVLSSAFTDVPCIVIADTLKTNDCAEDQIDALELFDEELIPIPLDSVSTTFIEEPSDGDFVFGTLPTLDGLTPEELAALTAFVLALLEVE